MALLLRPNFGTVTSTAVESCNQLWFMSAVAQGRWCLSVFAEFNLLCKIPSCGPVVALICVRLVCYSTCTAYTMLTEPAEEENSVLHPELILKLIQFKKKNNIGGGNNIS